MTALASDLPVSAFPASLRGSSARAWGAIPLLLVMLGLLGLGIASLVVNGSGAGFNTPARRVIAAPEQVRLQQQAAVMSATNLREVAPVDAVAMNAAVPVGDSGPAARPFIFHGSEADRQRSIECLAAAIYYESAREPLEGQRAVAQVVLNRVRHPAYPSSVCGVVFEGARRVTGCQFSFSCDGSLRRAPIASLWQRSREIAEAAVSGFVYAPVGWATHYHANYVVPYWASSLVKAANVGLHIFYRWTGGWGRAPAFTSRYTGVEPQIAWRGGFGQPTPAERLAAATEAGTVDAAAAAAAGEAAPIGSVDSFQRAVLRRYEPLRRETANAMITERARNDTTLTASQRWALTGNDSTAEKPQQRPLGRWGVAPAEPPAPTPPETAGTSPKAEPPARESGGESGTTSPGRF